MARLVCNEYGKHYYSMPNSGLYLPSDHSISSNCNPFGDSNNNVYYALARNVAENDFLDSHAKTQLYKNDKNHTGLCALGFAFVHYNDPNVANLAPWQ